MSSPRPISCSYSSPTNDSTRILRSSPVGQRQPRNGGSVEYIVEQRRTFYVKSNVPPEKWDNAQLKSLLAVAEEEGSASSPGGYRRTQSYGADKGRIEEVDDSSDSSESSYSTATGSDTGGQPSAPVASPTRSAPKPQLITQSIPPSPQKLRKPGPPPPIAPKPFFAPRNTQYRPRIFFYHRKDPHYGFTNFSPHPVVYKGKSYPTSEHLFQSFKFLEQRPLLAEHIRTFSDRPSAALSEARRFQPEARPDWMNMNVNKMKETLYLKFTQHPDLKQELLDTGDAELIEDSDKDSFWGVGADRKGRNELGKALEWLRDKLRAEQ